MNIAGKPAVLVEDIEIFHHRLRPLVVRMIWPDGPGPFPVILDLHGGCWCKGDPSECETRGRVFAAKGMASAALDFRQAEDRYPSSLEDINYALRWLKAHGAELQVDAERVGILGQSSGGHLAMLAAMRPGEPRYSALPLEANTDAKVRCVGMMWPVINPLSRYRRVIELRATNDPPAWVADLPERHDTYWLNEHNMEEGNPMLALERAEPVETPPAIWFQGMPDPVHDYRDPGAMRDLNEPERFAENYRRAGGTIEITRVDQADRSDPALLGPLIAFFRQNLA